jgi:hypothetical protein
MLRYAYSAGCVYVTVRAFSCILFLHPFSPSQSLATLVKTELARAGCTILVQ